MPPRNRLAEERQSKDELLEEWRAERRQWQEQLAEERRRAAAQLAEQRRRADKNQRVLLATIAKLVGHENGNGSPMRRRLLYCSAPAPPTPSATSNSG